METTYTLEDLRTRFHNHQQAIGRAEGTIRRYHFTFILFERYLEQTQREPTIHSLTTESMEAFATWLRETPSYMRHGSTRRQESGIHAHLRDLRAFCRWLHEAELLERVPKVPMPRLPKRLFRILTTCPPP